MPELFARVPYVRRCVMTRGGRAVEAVICNLSVVGVYVTFLRPLPSNIPAVGESVHISFLLPGDGEAIEGDATVTWQNLEEPDEAESLPPGCGLRFLSLKPSDHKRVAELIRDYLHASRPMLETPAPHSGFVRIPYVQPCLLVAEAATWEGVLCNLSLLGAYVAVDPIPPEGETLKLLFRLPKESQPTQVASQIVWVNSEDPLRAGSLPAGCGLRFIDLEEATRSAIKALVDAYESLPRDAV